MPLNGESVLSGIATGFRANNRLRINRMEPPHSATQLGSLYTCCCPCSWVPNFHWL